MRWAAGAALVVTSELVVCGYPPEDLVVRPIVNDTIQKEIEALAAETADGGPALLVGSPWRDGGKLHNAALLLDGGEIAAVRFKYDLPNYGVFDEKRVFDAGPLPGPVNFRGVRLGVMVCEDMWTDEVAECLQESGAEILVVLNGSPYQQDKWDIRLNLAVARATECGLPLIYVNQVGGQDELVFDGASFVLGDDASLRVQAPAWCECLTSTEWTRDGDSWTCSEGDKNPPPDGDGVAGGRLRGRRGRRESRQKRDLATLEKARGDARGSEARSGVSKLTIRDSGPRRRIRAGTRGRTASSRRERPSSPRLAVAAAPVVVVLLFYPRVREDGGSLVAEKTRADSKQAPPRRRSQSERAR